MSTILSFSAAVFTAGALFFGVLGIYEGWLRRFFEEVGQQDERSFLKSMQKVVLRRLGVLNRRFMSERFETRMRRKLTQAGDPADLKPEEIIGLQQIGAVVGLALGIYATVLVGWPIFLSVIPMAIGFIYPLMWVNEQVAKRHQAILRALPYNLDLLTLSVEAGLDFTAALQKVVEKGKPGPLLDEFALVLRQLKMGKTREEALKSMIHRVDLPAITSFLTSLIQADRMGTSLGKVLRIQSTQLRIERSQRAEKLANEAPVKMLFPLIACIFPTVFMILFGPIIFQFMYGNVGG
ncbi:MAG: type II secretion system F family protein [Deltaproteobacteria bacterium]|nr:MAG: type II secretion system F family protein [Deltaproteobacteria bacterium]